MNVPLLRVEDVTVVPPGAAVPACADVSFTVARGERIALVGESGAGKTTLLRALNGSLPTKTGAVFLDGEELRPTGRAALRRLRAKIAAIPQKHDLVDSLRVYQNVMTGALGRWSDFQALRFLCWPRASELGEARTALERVELAEKLCERAGTLSGGQQQRVAIARALVQRPILILADEPVASLDPRMAYQVLDLLCRLAEHDGVSLICTLHQPALAAQFFPRVLQMRGGRLVSDCRAASPAASSVPAELTSVA